MDKEQIQLKIENSLKKYNIISDKNTIILGYSGGEDSTFLLHHLVELSKKYGFKIIAAHLNHNWRGKESSSEQEKCADIANSLGVIFYTETLADNQKCSELAAREARYRFFNKCAIKFNSNSVITAHSQTDNIETVLFRVIKGTGLTGLGGIPETRNCGIYTVYRPMLNISRNEVIEYNREYNLERNCDSSNTNTKYARNNIRQLIIPQLKQINPYIEKSLARLICVANQETAIIDEYLNKIKNEICVTGKYKTGLFLKQSIQVQKRLIYDIVTSYKTFYDSNNVDELYRFILDNKSSKTEKLASITTEIWLSVSEKYIYAIKKSELECKTKSLIIPKEGEYLFENLSIIVEKTGECITKFSATNSTIYADLSKITFPLYFRTRSKNSEKADFIRPFGMDGHKMKLKKYLSSRKIALPEKKSILMLCKDNEILWIPKYGTSETIKITDKPTHKITITNRSKNDGT